MTIEELKLLQIWDQYITKDGDLITYYKCPCGKIISYFAYEINPYTIKTLEDFLNITIEYNKKVFLLDKKQLDK